MSTFLKAKAEGKTAGDIAKASLTPEGTYPSALSYIKFTEEDNILLFGFDSLSIKNEEGKPYRSFIRCDVDTIKDVETYEDLKQCKNFFDCFKVNSEVTTFFSLLFEIGCLKSEEGAVNFSPRGFYGRESTIRISHTTSKETGKTYANANVGLSRKSINTQPQRAIPSYEVPENFGAANNAIVSCFSALKNAGVLQHLIKLREDIGYKHVEKGRYELTILKFFDKPSNPSINIEFSAKKDDVSTKISLRFRKNKIEDMSQVDAIYNVVVASGKEITSEADFEGVSFLAELDSFEWNGNNYNTITEILADGAASVSPSLFDDTDDPFAE